MKKTALVTGASRGIGKAIAKALHEKGLTVAITGRDKKTLQSTAKEIGKNCTPFVCDHCNPNAIHDLSKSLGSIDILVNNAGVMHHAKVTDMSLDLWNEVIETNLTGTFLTTQAFLPGMIEKNEGDIIMISSMSGKKGDPGASAYAASKFGLQGFSQSLMYEVRRYNIRVMVLNPSLVDKSPETTQKNFPLHAEDLAKTVVHLLSLPRRTMIRDMDIYGTNPTND